MDEFCIIKGYRPRYENKHYIDLNEKDKYQKEVYVYVNEIMKKYNLKKVIDVGCGSGYKLVKYLGEYETIGFETEPCYSFLQNKYPNKKWVKSGEKEESFVEIKDKNCDIIMASDVIEHIRNPDELIKFMKNFNTKYFLFSTPARDILVKNFKHRPLGPPGNNCHVREWTFDEFKMYLSKHFNVIDSKLGEKQIQCQWHLCENKTK